MSAPQRMFFRIDLSPTDIEDYYRGAIRNVMATSIDGRTVKFPFSVIHSHIGHNGVHGMFAIEFDENNKFVALHRVGD